MHSTDSHVTARLVCAPPQPPRPNMVRSITTITTTKTTTNTIHAPTTNHATPRHLHRLRHCSHMQYSLSSPPPPPPVAKLSAPSLRPHKASCVAAQRLCLPAQALAIRATRGATQAGTCCVPRLNLPNTLAAPNATSQPIAPPSSLPRVRLGASSLRLHKASTRSTRRLSPLRRRSLRAGGAIPRLALCAVAERWHVTLRAEPELLCDSARKARVGGFLRAFLTDCTAGEL